MSQNFRMFLPLCAAASGSFYLLAQQVQRPELTARELFYNSGGAPAVSTADGAKQATKKVIAKKKPVTPATEQAASAPQPAQQKTQPSPDAGAPSQHDGGKIIPVTESSRATAPAPASGTALGLKYTLLKLTSGSMTAVAPNTVFHAGDKIQFSIETNGPGYLYIVAKGSSGTWKPMFPSPEIEGGNNRVEGFHTYTFPSGYIFTFDQQAGDEKMFIILSREAKPDFEQLVYSLQGVKTNKQPVQQEKAEPVIRASIDDSAVGRLHQTYARDLVIERVGDDAKADTQEKAVYVVNPSGNPDSALVADLNLVHQ